MILLLGQWSGSQPERDSVSAASAELDLEFASRRIDVGELTLHVVFAGPEDGPPIVLLHGFPEFWYAWRGPAAYTGSWQRALSGFESGRRSAGNGTKPRRPARQSAVLTRSSPPTAIVSCHKLG